MRVFHWRSGSGNNPGQLPRGCHRPPPHNGSGDSPRPPFLSVLVNQVGQLALARLVYHLFGGHAGAPVHAHIQRSIRLKTKSSSRLVQLQAARRDKRKIPAMSWQRQCWGARWQLWLKPVPEAASAAIRPRARWAEWKTPTTRNRCRQESQATGLSADNSKCAACCGRDGLLLVAAQPLWIGTSNKPCMHLRPFMGDGPQRKSRAEFDVEIQKSFVPVTAPSNAARRATRERCLGC